VILPFVSCVVVLPRVCKRLNRIPLAIGLAAARARVLTVEQISTRLAERHRFRLLKGDSGPALERRQTLRTIIAWSRQLLPAPERLWLQRPSVFSGGWTLEVAEQVCTGGASRIE
jgi:predicted ATPase